MHIIRLRGPWEVEPIARFVPQAEGTYQPQEENLPAAARMKMPADWSGAFGPDFCGRVAYRRLFHWTTPLYETERVFLVVEPPRSHACVTLKKKLVGFVDQGEPAKRFDITDRLEENNELEILVDHPSLNHMRSTVGDPRKLPPGGLIGEVRLEIEE